MVVLLSDGNNRHVRKVSVYTAQTEPYYQHNSHVQQAAPSQSASSNYLIYQHQQAPPPPPPPQFYANKKPPTATPKQKTPGIIKFLQSIDRQAVTDVFHQIE